MGGNRRLIAEFREPFIIMQTRAQLRGIGKGPIMKPSLALAMAFSLALVANLTVSRVALAQGAPQCNDFVKLKTDTEQKAMAVRTANQRHTERKEICALMTRFTTTEAVLVKFLKDNQTWCGVPEQVVKQALANHEQAMKFRTAACAEAPEGRPKVPTLSDAITTPSVDTSKNTKTGRGTFDTLTGNPLAR
jgi:hypothetical protein